MQHFGFYIPNHSHCRALPLTYDNYIDGTGFSGTEASLIEIAHGLQQMGRNVTIMQDGDTTAANMAAQQLDFFSPLFFLDSSAHNIIAKTRPDCKIAVWLHCYVSHADLLAFKTKIAPRPFFVIAVSSTVARHASGGPWPVHVVPNGINASIWGAPPPLPPSRKHHVFIATYERGGAVAAVVAEKLGKELKTASYYLKNHPNHIASPSLSKRALRALLDTCDIFVYPLVLPNGEVHHDTYACCVHEAMAAGVLVVTWDVACFRDVYPQDTITLVKPIPYSGYDPYAKYGKNPALASPEAVARLCDAVAALDRDVPRKERMRHTAREWALQHTWDESLHAFLAACQS